MAVLTRKQRDKLIRQTDILKAAERVFAIKGYHDATIQDIAEEAQYSVGTIYLYFKDKEGLYLHLIEGKIEDLISIVKKGTAYLTNPKDKIKSVVFLQLHYFEENQDFFRIYFSHRGGLPVIKDRVSKTALDKFIKYIDYISEVISEAQNKGFIKASVEPKRLAYLLASMLNAVIIPWLKESDQKEKITGMTDFIMDIFFNGVEQR